jgi:hypothetical protein
MPFRYNLKSQGFKTPRYVASGLANWLSIDSKTGEIYGYPKQPGIYNFKVWAVEGTARTGAVKVSLNIKDLPQIQRNDSVKVVNPPRNTKSPPIPIPKIICESSWEGRVGEQFSKILQCEDLPFPNYFADGLPPGIKIDKYTGNIFGYPTQVGNYRTFLYAKNSIKETEKVEISFKVLTPKIIELNKIVVKGILEDFLIHRIDHSHFTFSKFETDALPSGLKLNHKNQCILGHPSETGSFVTRVKMFSLKGKIYEQEIKFEISKPSFQVKAKIGFIHSSFHMLFPEKNQWKGTRPQSPRFISLWDKYKKIHIGTAKVKDMNENTIRIHPPVMFYRSPSYKKGTEIIVTEAVNDSGFIESPKEKLLEGTMKKMFFSRTKFQCTCYNILRDLSIGSRVSVSFNGNNIGQAEVVKILAENFEIEFIIPPKIVPPKTSEVTFMILD